MCMIYLHTTSKTARFTVLFVTATRKKDKKDVSSLQPSCYFTLYNITLKKYSYFFKFHFEASSQVATLTGATVDHKI